MMTRKDFMAGAGALAGFGLTGCGSFAGSRQSRAHASAYWCTWATQSETLAGHRMTGELKFPGDQGVPGVRDNLNEDILFGPKGWINLFPESRADMMFLVDDGWDVPYGAKGGRAGIHSFGSLVPDRERFPSFGVTASDRDRLRAFARRTEDAGWKGLGVWVACQAYRERFEAPFRLEELKEDLRRKFDEAAYAGVKYWKVDWGVHNFHVWYRRLMSEMKERYYPELIIDHCRGFNNAINGAVDPYLKPASDTYRNQGATGRIFGVPEYDPITRDYEEIMSFSDVFRTYDSAHPMTTATMLERAAWELECADKSGSRVVINTEDEPLIAAGLGLELSMMRAPVWPGNPVRDMRPRHKRMAEDMRCLVWQRNVPAFGSDTPAKTRHSEASIRESWHFLPGECWFTGQQEITYFQVAPASVTRGLPLPEVRGRSDEVPYVIGSRHPNGACAFAALPLLDPKKGSYTPPADVRFDAALGTESDVAVFGEFGSLTLDDRTSGRRIVAQDILGGERVDITGECRFAAGRVTLPGMRLAEIGTAQNPARDDSPAGTLVKVLGVLVAALGLFGTRPANADLVDDVDVFVGTVAEGNCFPGACRPFGFVQASPDTGRGVTPPGYKYNDGAIRGFSQTHLNGTGCPALGDISLMPFVGAEKGPLHLHAYDRASEKGSPDLYEVTLDNGVRVRGTAANRVGLWRFTYATDAAKHLYFDAASSLLVNYKRKYGPFIPESAATLAPSRDEIRGYRHTLGWSDRKVYYCARFSRPWSRIVQEPRDAFEGMGERFTLDFADLKAGETLEVRVAVSTVSAESAAANLAAEGDWSVSFEQVRAATRSAWNALLGRVTVEGSAAERKNFYTALYHLCIQPNDIADADGRYRGADDCVRTAPCGNYYSTLSLWDTYRAAHPLYTILYPERVNGFVETMSAHARAHGHLPVWTLWGGETHDMIGVHAIPVLADAYFKGFGGADWNEVLVQMVNSLIKVRPGCGAWNVFWENGGYLPYRPGHWDEGWEAGGCCSKTLEVCYDWWCVERLAAALGNERTRANAAERAKGWQKIFDRETGFIRPRGPAYEGGEWRTPFDPRLVKQDATDFYGDYTEANAWQYTWHVMQDPMRLAELLGGCEKAVAKLDEFFATPPVRPKVVGVNNDAGGCAEKDGQIGQYWHGNEPSHHIVYLYTLYGAPRKAQRLLRKIAAECYRPTPDGLCGNDDCGQMSAWYLFTAMGFYPLNPCGGDYVLGAPQLPRIALRLANGKTFAVVAKNLSKENLYVRSVTLNGRPLAGNVLRHRDILAGGELVFEMCP